MTLSPPRRVCVSTMLSSTLAFVFIALTSSLFSYATRSPYDPLFAPSSSDAQEWPVSIDAFESLSNDLPSLDSLDAGAPDWSLLDSGTLPTGGLLVTWVNTGLSTIPVNVVQGVKTTVSVPVSIVDRSHLHPLPDSELGLATITVKMTNGTLFFPSTAGLNFTSGDPQAGSNSFTILSTYPDFNRSLQSFQILTPPTYFDTETITFNITFNAHVLTYGTSSLSIQLRSLSSITAPPAVVAPLTMPATLPESSTQTISGVLVSTNVSSTVAAQITIVTDAGQVKPTTTTGLTFSGDLSNRYRSQFTCLVSDCNKALASLSVSTDAYNVNTMGAFTLAITINDNNPLPNPGPQSTTFTNVFTIIPAKKLAIPTAVSAPSVSSVNSTAATISWLSSPVNFTVTPQIPAASAYILQTATKASPTDADFTIAYQGSSTSVSLSGLIIGGTYYVRVALQNGGGISPFSAVTSFTTVSGTPNIPTGVSITTVKTTFAQLSWTAPATASNIAPIDYYQITVTPDGGKPVTLKTPSADTQYTLSGLTPNTAYSVVVVAHNIAGLGAQGSTPLTVTTVPLAPTIVSFVASDPDNTHNTCAAGSIATVTFSAPIRNVQTGKTIDQTACAAYVTPSTSIGTYQCQWTTSSTLVITWIDPANTQPTIGLLFVNIASGSSLTTQGLASVSDAATGKSPLLSGSWGTAHLQSLFIAPSATPTFTQGGTGPLNVGLNATTLTSATQLSLIVQVILPGFDLTTQTANVIVAANVNKFTDGTNTKYQMLAAGSAIATSLPSVVFSPPATFWGTATFQWFLYSNSTVSPSNVIASIISTVNVLPINHAPVIGPSGASLAGAIYDVAIQPFSASTNTLLQLTDADLATFPLATSAVAQLSLQLSTGGLGWFNLSQALGTVTYSPQAGSKASIHTLTGTFADLNTALATFQIQYGINPVNIQSASIQLIINDNGNGYAGVPALAGSLVFPMSFVCGSSTPAAQVQVAIESNDASFITINFDRPIIAASSNVNCPTIFSASTMNKIGTDATCIYNYDVVSGVSSLVITYGSNPTFLAGTDKLTILANSIPRCSPATTQSAISASVVAGDYAVTPGIPLSPPVASITAPSNIDPLCASTFTLNGLAVNVGPRAPTYAWTLPSNRSNVVPVAPSALNTASLVLKNTDFPAGSSYTFSLVVTSFQGVSSSVATATVVSKANAAVVTIRGVNPIQVLKGNDLTISASVVPSICTPSNANVTSQWSFSPAIALDTSASSAQTPDLVVMGGTLTAGATYQFTYTATVNGLNSTQSVKVIVMRSPLVVGLGGASSSQPFSLDLVVNAAKFSYDPDATPSASSALTFTYSCRDGFGNACFDKNSVTLNLATYVNNGVLTIPAVTLVPGVYTFGVTVSDSASGRTGTATTVVSLTSSALPSVQVSCPAIVNPNALVALAPVIGVAGAGVNVSQLAYTWTSNQVVNFVDPATTLALPGGGVSLNTKFQTRYWIPNTNYLFSLAVKYTPTGESAGASCQVHINAAPTGCVFSSSATSGSLNDSFALTVNGCYDPDGVGTAMLSYQFFYMDSQGNRRDISVEAPFNSFVASNVFPVSSNLVVGVRVFDQYRAVTTVNYANTLTITKPVVQQPASTFTSALSAAVNNKDTEKLIAGVTYLTNALVSQSVSLADSTTTTTLITSALKAISTLASQLPTSTVTQQLSTLCSAQSCDSTSSSTALTSLVNSFSSAYNLFPSNTYDASILNAVFGLVSNLAQTSLFSTSSFHSSSMHLMAVTPTSPINNIQSVISQSLLAFSQSSALPLTGDGTIGFVIPPNTNITSTIVRDLNFNSTSKRFFASTYRVPIVNGSTTITLTTNANTFGVPSTNTVGLDFAFTVMTNSPFKTASATVPPAAFLAEPIIVNVNSVQASNTQLLNAISLTGTDFGTDYITVQQPYKCTPATGSSSCMVVCIVWDGTTWQGKDADTDTSVPSFVSCKLRAPAPFAIVDANRVAALSGPFALTWSSVNASAGYTGSFSPAIQYTSGDIQLNVDAYSANSLNTVPLVLTFTADQTQPNYATDIKMYPNCGTSLSADCSGVTAVSLCSSSGPSVCASFVSFTVSISTNSSLIRNRVVLTGSNSRQTSIYINIVKSTIATSGPFVLNWASTEGTFSSPTHTNGSTVLRITDASFPPNIPINAPWSTTGPNSASNVVLLNCKDAACQTSTSSTLCSSAANCTQAGVTGSFSVSLAGSDTTTSVYYGLRLDGINGYTTLITFTVTKPTLTANITNATLPGAPADGNLRIRIPLGAATITFGKAFSTYSRFSTQSTVLNVGTKQYNDLLRVDICLALSISTDDTYCKARVNVLASSVDSSGAYYAYVDLIAITNTNNTLYGDLSVGNLLAKLKTVTLKDFPNAKLSDIAQYCLNTASYAATCPTTATSSGTPWYVPVIVVVVVIGVVGIAIAVYFVIKSRNARARGGAKQLGDDDGVEMTGADIRGSPGAGPAAAVHHDDGPMAVYGSMDDGSTYPAAQPGIKYMYQPADWNPEDVDDTAQGADKSDVHLNLEDDAQGKKAITPTRPKPFTGIDNSNDTARFTYTSN